MQHQWKADVTDLARHRETDALPALGSVVAKDLVIEAGLKSYDYAPFLPIFEGAGGGITDWKGRPLDLSSGDRVIAYGDARAHAQALELLA